MNEHINISIAYAIPCQKGGGSSLPSSMKLISRLEKQKLFFNKPGKKMEGMMSTVMKL